MGVSPRLIDPVEGERVLRAWALSHALGSDDLALAVRFSLQLLRQKAPGNSVEVRVPPFGAAQVIDGPRHTRGTPPAVIEIEPTVWLDLVVGQLDFDQAVAAARLAASGARANLQGFLPLWQLG